MKTGFTCSAGYNVVASAERDGRHLIAVIMGAPSTGERNRRAAALFDRFFASRGASIGSLDSLPGSGATVPPDNHDIVCGRGRASAVAEAEAEDSQIGVSGATETSLLPTPIAFEPVRVFVGPVPGWSGRVAQAVGAGAREFAAAPGKPSVHEQRAAMASAASAGPLEGSAPGPGSGPLALLGATAAEAPAALAARHLVRAAPSLGLKVASRKRLARGHHITPVTAVLAKPSLLATAEPSAAVPHSPVPAAKAAPAGKAKTAAKPKPAVAPKLAAATPKLAAPLPKGPKRKTAAAKP